MSVRVFSDPRGSRSAPPALEFLRIWDVHSILDPLRDALSNVKMLSTSGSCALVATDYLRIQL